MRGRLYKEGTLVFIFYLICCYSPAFADTEQRALTWTSINIFGQVPKTSSYLYNLNLQSRYNLTRKEYETRTEAGVGYKLTSSLSAWLGGTVFLPNAPVPRQYRIWQQILWIPTDTRGFNFISRTRVEERKLEHQSQWSDRLVQRSTLSFPYKITPLFYNEIYINLNHPVWVASKVIDQNRNFVGIEVPIFKQLRLQVGYLNIYLFRPERNREDHILHINFNLNT